jgi:lipopolysaccharide export system permease protein
MLRLVDRYLLREIAASFFSVASVLMLVTLGGMLTLTLDRISRGKMPAALLLSQIGLRSVDALPLLMPLAVFLAVLLAYGRLYRDSEMSVLSASGYAHRALLRPVWYIAVPLTIALALLSFWLGPAAVRKSDRMIDAANRSLLVVGMEPGRFIELPGRESVVYVAEMSADGSRFKRLFVHEQRDNRVDVTTAEHGELYQDRDGDERYLSLRDGFRAEGEPGKSDWRLMRFARNDIRLPEAGENADRQAEKRTSTLALWASPKPIDQAEFHWRLGLPLSALVLAMLAVPLSRSQPREPRYAKALLAVVAYVVYTNMMALGRGWIADGTLPVVVGLWWLHFGVLAIGLWLLSSDERALRRQMRR